MTQRVCDHEEACGCYVEGYDAGKGKAHSEVRMVQRAGHSHDCGCEPCKTVRIVHFAPREVLIGPETTLQGDFLIEAMFSAAQGVLLAFLSDQDQILDTCQTLVKSAVDDPPLDSEGLVDVALMLMTVSGAAVACGRDLAGAREP